MQNLSNGADAAKRILIIEDDAVVARLYQNRLRKEGYRVEIAVEGQEGFFTILKDKPDGVLLDLMLPNMDGIQILRKTRAQKQFEALPIIVFSNSFISGMLDEAVSAGATRVFNKSDPATTQNIVAGFMDAFFPMRARELRAAAAQQAEAPAEAPVPEGGTMFYQRQNTPATAAGGAGPAKPAFVAPTPRFGAIPVARPSFDANGALVAGRMASAPPPRTVAPPPLPLPEPAPTPIPPPTPAAVPPPAPAPVAKAAPEPPPGGTIFLARSSPLLPSGARIPGPCVPPGPDTAFVPMSEDAVEMQVELVKIFFEGGPETIAGIRKSMRGYSKEPATVAGQAQLNALYRRIHSLTGSAGMASLESIGNYAACLEAYLRELLTNPINFQPSTLRSLANAVDLLGSMFDKGPAFHCPLPTDPVVLVVDDDVISRRAVTFGLEKAGLKAIGTADPHHALDELDKKLFELIFLDVDMPDMDGFELCSRIRHKPDYLHSPVVFITSMTDFQTRAKSITSGGNDFISKPLCFMELAVKALTFVLKGRLNAQTPLEKTAV